LGAGLGLGLGLGLGSGFGLGLGLGDGLGFGSGVGVGFVGVEPGPGLGCCGSCTAAMLLKGDSAKTELPDNAVNPINERALLARITRIVDCIEIYLRGRLIEVPALLDHFVRCSYVAASSHTGHPYLSRFAHLCQIICGKELLDTSRA